MVATKFLDTKRGRKIAYHHSPGQSPCVVFLGGLKSDMEGTKAVYLEKWAKAQGREFLRFDYSGHGESSGKFTDGCIGDWAEDSLDVVVAVTDRPLVLVGSSMGGWQSLLLSKAIPYKIAGLVTIAAAPDFTEDGYWRNFSATQKAELEQIGHVELPSDYMEPYIITKRMIEDGRRQLVLRDPLALPFPVRCLQGTEDTAVSSETAIRLLEHADSPNMRLTLVKGADHRFSDETCLTLIVEAVQDVLETLT
ncbi:MAG: alpha/beta hydrolase [Paracoccaceae bacterium]